MKTVKVERTLVRQFLRDHLVVSLVPVVILVILGIVGAGALLRYADGLVDVLSTDLVAVAEAQVRYLGQDVIRNRARDVARQVDIYLAAHPDATIAELQARPEFQAIALQAVGETGYTAIHEAETDIVRFHATNPGLIDTDAGYLAETLPEFWMIFHTPHAREQAGYYSWIEPTGEIRDKYMVVTPVSRRVEGATLMVAATTYIDEFARPMVAVRGRAREARVGYDAAVRQVAWWGGGALALMVLLIVALTHQAIRRGVQAYIQPLRDLTERARNLGTDDAGPPLPTLTSRADEIGALAQALARAEGRVRESLHALEQCLAEESVTAARQSQALQAATAVANAASTVSEPERFLWRAADLIQEHLGLYHAGILLVDKSGEWLEYRAGSGPEGRLIVERGARFEIGAASPEGRCAAQSRQQVIPDTRDAEHFVENPDLPQTRSAVLRPLMARGEVIGVLDVQSAEPDAFDPLLLSVLAVIADQIALALDNVHLQTQLASGAASGTAEDEVRQEAWTQLLKTGGAAGYLRDLMGNIRPVDAAARPEMRRAAAARKITRLDETTLAVPVMSRDQVLGVARLRKPEDEGRWTDQELAVVQTLIEQLGVALESARLYQDTQKAAARERMTGEISSRIRESLDMDTMLQVAIREIGEALELSRVKVRMVTAPELEHDARTGPARG